jgi:hypothetical protein
VFEREDRKLLFTFTANNTGDSGSGSGLVGDLRHCVNQANSAGGYETIHFDATVFKTPQTIALTSAQGQLDLNYPSAANLTILIMGPSAGVTLSGNDSTRMFAVETCQELVSLFL